MGARRPPRRHEPRRGGATAAITSSWSGLSRIDARPRARRERALALPSDRRRPVAPAKRARPAPLLPLSPQLKRARPLASVDNLHDIDAAQVPRAWPRRRPGPPLFIHSRDF